MPGLSHVTAAPGLKIMQWNARGLAARQLELKQFLATYGGGPPDVICLEETYLKEGKLFSLPGYDNFRKDRVNRNGGGVATFVKKDLNAVQIDTPDQVECIGIKVKLKNSYIQIYNVYNPPDITIDKSSYKKFFENINSIVTGDFNSKNSLWNSPDYNKNGYILEELIDENNFVVINTGQPTYQMASGGQSHLDLTLTSTSLALKCQWFTINSTLGSDHQPTFTVFNEIPDVTENSQRFKLDKADWDNFTDNCKNVFKNWDQSIADPNVFLNSILNRINIAAENCIPRSKPNKRRQGSKQLPYWNDRCRKAIYERNRARNKMNKTKELKDCIEFRRLKGVAQNIIKTESRNYWQSYCSKIKENENLASVWRLARKMNGAGENIRRHILKLNGVPAEHDLEKANLMAQHFAKISSNDNYSDNFKTSLSSKESKIYDEINSSDENSTNTELNENFNLAELYRAIKNLKDNTSPGDDNINYELIKHLPRKAVKILLKFYNRLWQDGVLPVDFKHAIIIPIHKPDKDPTNPSSYRPISLTSTIGKLMERLVTNRLNWFLEKNKLLNNNQSGFRNGRSTQDNIVRLHDQINKFIKTQGCTLGVFLDFEKAYDMIWRPGLLVKLKRLGISGNLLNYVKTFLSDRTFQVKIGNILSTELKLENGIAQGSIIAPLLFLIMINDFPDSPSVDNMLFADDSAVFKSGRNINFLVQQIQIHLSKVQNWCDEWGFKLSPTKTVAVFFTLKKVPECLRTQLKIGNIVIKCEKVVKFLGVMFDSQLSFRNHIQYMESKCKRRLNLMQVISSQKWGADLKSLLTIYKTLIRPIIDYGSIAYDTAPNSLLQIVERIQNKALRICTGCMRSTQINLLQNECGIMPLKLRRLEQQIKFAVKIKGTVDHPAAKAADDNWANHYGNQNRQLFYSKINKFFETTNVDQDQHRLSDIAPWHFKNINVDLGLSNIVRKDDPPEIIKSVALEYFQQYENSFKIYTDGSKSDSGLVSSAFYIKDTQEKFSFRISNNLTIYTAELTAIRETLNWVKLNENNFNNNHEIAIFSDSKSSLESINKLHSSLRPNLLTSILELLTSITIKIVLVWIPAHVNLTGNEIVDQLAKAALLNKMIDINIKFETRELYSSVEKYVLNQWQIAYNNIKTLNTYKKYNNKVSNDIKYVEPKRASQVLITRLRLGACCLNHNLYKINCHEDGLCVQCKIPENVEHFLINCPHSNVAIALKSKCLDLKLPFDLQHCLSVPALTRTICAVNTRSGL